VTDKPDEKPATPSTETKNEASTAQVMKNKTMEEIINKWTGDLDRCGEQFKNQANDIRRWDAVLVENGDKVIT
jgi:nuclear pore complex protein Nup62